MEFTEIKNEEFNLAFETGFTGPSFDLLEPATGRSLGTLQAATASEVAGLVVTAKMAQVKWSAIDFDSKAKILRKFADLLEQNADLIHSWNARECGSIVPKSQWELQASIDQTHMCAAMTMMPSGEIYPSNMPGRTNKRVRVPIGVVGVISPWNFPLLLSLRAVLPAIAMGNAVIIKPDPQSSITGGLLIQKLLEQAGLPEGIVTVAYGAGDVGAALVDNSDVGMIAFTGSTLVGKEIAATCGRNLKKTSLELGGNNAFIVLDDADLESASSCGAWGAFLHQGQICMQAGRHIVHESKASDYASALKARAEALYVGNPHSEQCHLGPLINSSQADRVMKLINDSVAMGAKVICGGTRDGLKISPTVMIDVTTEMPIFKEEIFGPVAPIITFANDQEAVALANQAEHGLSASIHTANTARGNMIADQVDAGMIHVNDQTVNNEYQVPFGGLKASGDAGRIGGPVNLDEFTTTKWISSMEKGIVYPF